MPAGFIETELQGEVASLAELLGETASAFATGRRRSSPGTTSSTSICRSASRSPCPLSAELQLEVRRLTASLRALDPH